LHQKAVVFIDSNEKQNFDKANDNQVELQNDYNYTLILFEHFNGSVYKEGNEHCELGVLNKVPESFFYVGDNSLLLHLYDFDKKEVALRHKTQGHDQCFRLVLLQETNHQKWNVVQNQEDQEFNLHCNLGVFKLVVN
jgi:hypothetical protein